MYTVSGLKVTADGGSSQLVRHIPRSLHFAEDRNILRSGWSTRPQSELGELQCRIMSLAAILNLISLQILRDQYSAFIDP